MRRAALPTVLLLWACGGRPHQPASVASPPPQLWRPRPSQRPVARPDGPEVLVGFFCPSGAAGRPALLAAAVRSGSAWSTAPADLHASLARGRVRELAVLGFAGRQAGRFTPLGPLAGGAAMALGAYAGAAPCADEATAADCQAASLGCGLAAGVSEADEAPRLRPHGACAASGHLVIDLDGDGKTEAFPLAELAAGLDEVGQDLGATGLCTPKPAGALGEGVDLLGAADLDGDGRLEVTVGARSGGKRRALIYGAGDTPARLDLIGAVDLPNLGK